MKTKYLEVPFAVKEDGISDEGIIKGLASPFGGPPDDGGDIIVKGAFDKTIKAGGRNGTGVVMLSQHGRKDKTPIGVWNSLIERDKGLEVEGKMFIGDPNEAKGTMLANETFVAAKGGGLTGLSIGWDFPRDKDGMRLPESFEYDSSKGCRYLKQIDLWEISLVTFPMARRGQITNIKDVEGIKTERQLEEFLRDSGNMSKKAAQFIVTLAKPSLRELRENEDKGGDKNGDEDLLQILDVIINNVKSNLTKGNN